VHGQPGGLVVEVAGVTRPMPSPRHRSHRGAMIPTGHPGSVTLQKDPTGAQVQSPPPSPPRPPVIARRAPPATPTPMAGLGRRTDRDDQRRSHLIEIDRFDHGILQPERSLQYPLLFAPRSVSCLRSRQIARKRRKQTGCDRGWSTQTPTDPSGEPNLLSPSVSPGLRFAPVFRR
jgi:hypothetical protein